MTPLLIAFAGPSRSGKGTCAKVASQLAAERGLSFRERQLSGPGKRYLAQAFKPGISEDDAIEWFETLKGVPGARVTIEPQRGRPHYGEATLQEYMQRMLQGARDSWGEDFWTDRLLPVGMAVEPLADRLPAWWRSFETADVCVISDLRQVNEAARVRQLGGLVVEVVRPMRRDPYVTGRDHVTEQRLPDGAVDHVVVNDCGVPELIASVAAWLAGVLPEGRP